MLQTDLIKQAKDIEAINVESCIIESDEIFIEKPWIRRLPESSISYINRCVNKKKVPEVKEKPIPTAKAEPNGNLPGVKYEYPYTVREKARARALDIMCVNTPRGIQCLSFEEALKLRECSP